MKNALITTTINIPHNLEAYAKDIATFGPKDTAIVVAGDKKTPPEIQQFLDRLYSMYDVPTFYLSPELQDELFPSYSKFMPWNSVQRRNMAILYAYHAGAEIIATTDDDNFWEGEGYFAGHGIVGQNEKITAVSTDSGWYNPCTRLQTINEMRFFPRGFSLRKRKDYNTISLTSIFKEGKCMVNAGLWIGEPDIDALTRLGVAPTVTDLFDKESYSLAINTKCPFNSQNTALHRDVIPAYCMVHGIGRYDDIIPSYVVKRIADHLGDYIRFGSPIVRQVRNQHDLWKDLEDERIGMQLTDQIVEWLYEIQLTGTTYKKCVQQLMTGLKLRYVTAWANRSITQEQLTFMDSVYLAYEKWAEVL